MKLHLGCGKVKLSGFVQVDLADYSHVDYKQDIRCLPQFRNESVDLIYCCHALEYFDRFEAYVALREWHRVLKNGGVLRLAVPDFEAIVKVYLKDKNLDQRGVLGPLYGRMQLKDGCVLYHKTAYDFESLRTLLTLVGFKNVHRYDWRQTEHADVDDYSQSHILHMDKERGLLISLNVEATK